MKLVEDVRGSIKKKYEAYQNWVHEVDGMDNANESKLIEESRIYLLENEYNYIEELMALDYIRYENESKETFILGDNKDSDYLVAICEVMTVDNGLITESENDYYEVAKQQYEKGEMAYV